MSDQSAQRNDRLETLNAAIPAAIEAFKDDTYTLNAITLSTSVFYYANFFFEPYKLANGLDGCWQMSIPFLYIEDDLEGMLLGMARYAVMKMTAENQRYGTNTQDDNPTVYTRESEPTRWLDPSNPLDAIRSVIPAVIATFHVDGHHLTSITITDNNKVMFEYDAMKGGNKVSVPLTGTTIIHETADLQRILFDMATYGLQQLYEYNAKTPFDRWR